MTRKTTWVKLLPRRIAKGRKPKYVSADLYALPGAKSPRQSKMRSTIASTQSIESDDNGALTESSSAMEAVLD